MPRTHPPIDARAPLAAEHRSTTPASWRKKPAGEPATTSTAGQNDFQHRWKGRWRTATHKSRAAYAEIKFILLTLTLTLTPTTDPPKRFPYFIPYLSSRQKNRVVCAGANPQPREASQFSSNQPTNQQTNQPTNHLRCRPARLLSSFNTKHYTEVCG